MCLPIPVYMDVSDNIVIMAHCHDNCHDTKDLVLIKEFVFYIQYGFNHAMITLTPSIQTLHHLMLSHKIQTSRQQNNPENSRTEPFEFSSSICYEFLQVLNSHYYQYTLRNRNPT